MLSWLLPSGMGVIRFPAWHFCIVEQLGDSIGEGSGRVWATQLSEEMIWQPRYVLISFIGVDKQTRDGRPIARENFVTPCPAGGEPERN